MKRLLEFLGDIEGPLCDALWFITLILILAGAVGLLIQNHL